MTVVVLKGYVLVPSEDLAAVRNELPIHIGSTRLEEGCLIFDVIQDELNPNRFNVHEEFVDRDAFANHQDRVKDSNWGKVSANIERHYHVGQR